jgi:trans-aconitate 2-methyltransferase
MNANKEIIDWNPQLYLKYKNERTQPSIDLVSRINIDNPMRIIDIGCGPGNSTQILGQRWPNSQIVGLDNSPKMIEKAKSDYPKQKWILSDALDIDSKIKYNIVFSNATIQWVPNHEKLIMKLFSLVEDNGALAIQLPKFRDMPLEKSIEQVAKKTKWDRYTQGCDDLFTYHNYNFYYDILAKHSNLIDMWETSYIHILASPESILEWIRSTGMKPYLDRLGKDEIKNEFEKDVLEEIKKYYPVQKNGKVLFPFKRLFFIAYK